MERKKHLKKEIEQALVYAEKKDWRVETGGSHAWGKIYCPFNDKDCRCGEFCIASIWSTPKSPHHHARQIKRIIDNCAVINKHNAINRTPSQEQ